MGKPNTEEPVRRTIFLSRVDFYRTVNLVFIIVFSSKSHCEVRAKPQPTATRGKFREFRQQANCGIYSILFYELRSRLPDFVLALLEDSRPRSLSLTSNVFSFFLFQFLLKPLTYARSTSQNELHWFVKNSKSLFVIWGMNECLMACLLGWAGEETNACWHLLSWVGEPHEAVKRRQLSK